MLITVLSFIIGLVGVGLLSTGAWLISPSVGFITGGLICLLWSFLIARSISTGFRKPGGE